MTSELCHHMTRWGEMDNSQKRLTVELFDAHRSELERYAARIVGCPSRAEDIVQDAFIRLVKGQGNSLLNKPFGYVLKTVRNLAIDVLRREQREARIFALDQTAEQVEGVITQKGDPETALVCADELQIIVDVLNRLPIRMRRAVLLHMVEGLSLREISEQLEVSLGSAHALVKEGTVECRKALIKARL